MDNGFSPLGEVDSEEFDHILELIVAILFMAFGITATILMIRVMDAKTQIVSRVDKVEVSYLDIEDNNPFKFTGYEAYMFGWMIDTTSDTAITWTNGDLSGNIYATIDPIKQSSNFITVRNNTIRTEVANSLASGFSDINDQIAVWKGDTDDYYELVYTNEYKNIEEEGTENRWTLKLTR